MIHVNSYDVYLQRFHEIFTKSGGNRNLPEYLVALYLDMFLPCKTHVASGYSRSKIISWVFWNIHHQSMQVPFQMEVLFQSHPRKKMLLGSFEEPLRQWTMDPRIEHLMKCVVKLFTSR